MTIAKTIQKPRNWQDFERLCKKLFGEVWGCGSTIQANGRSGQIQHGVDIYGVPAGESAHFGVQCKGKDDYLISKLTAQEIDDEILKARDFKPPLKVFFIATTASKDSNIEEHVRIADLASRKRGSFSVVLFCWEDLADLIEEHRATFNWWVRERRHREQFKIEVAFSNGNKEATIRPTFRRLMTKKVSRYSGRPQWVTQFEKIQALATRPNFFDPLGTDSQNLSYVPLEIRFTNAGEDVIEDYRLDFDAGTGGQRFSDGLGSFGVRTRASLHVEDHSFWYQPADGHPLTQSDSRSFKVLVRPDPKQTTIQIEWNLYARDFATSGRLLVSVDAVFKDVSITTTVEDASDIGTTETIEDEVQRRPEE